MVWVETLEIETIFLQNDSIEWFEKYYLFESRPKTIWYLYRMLSKIEDRIGITYVQIIPKHTKFWTFVI